MVGGLQLRSGETKMRQAPGAVEALRHTAKLAPCCLRTQDDDNLPVPPDLLLLSVPQAARLLGVSRTGLYGLVRAGTIETIKVGGLRKVPRQALVTFIENRCAVQRTSVR